MSQLPAGSTPTALPTDVPLESSPGGLLRIVSLDTYRGFVMLLMMAEVLNLCQFKEDGWLGRFLCHHQSHVEWVGCSLHDLIQPSFSLLVGVSLPFSIASRRKKGHGTGRLIAHAGLRALILTALGVFLRSMHRNQTYFTFEDTLSQIGLGYFFLVLLGFRPVRDQVIALVLILVGYWALFAAWPLPGEAFDWNAAGVAKDWEQHLTGFAAHWNMNTNPAWAFDTWFLNLFPRAELFTHNGGGYATLSFIPTLGTMILGLLAGNILKHKLPPAKTLAWFMGGGLAMLAAGYALGYLGICPVVKKIWTPSWVLFSGGWCWLLLAVFHGLVDLLPLRRLFFPLVVIGINSIAAYVIAHTLHPVVEAATRPHLTWLSHVPAIGQQITEKYEHLALGICVLVIYWLILWWMHSRRLYVRI